MKQVERILFSGDIFRTTTGESNQVTNIFWIKSLLESAIEKVTEIPIDVAYGMDLETYGFETTSSFYRALNLSPSLDSWAQIFCLDEPEQSLTDLVLEPIARALLIIFEIPPVMENILNRADIPWISVEIDPLRFLPDFLFALRCSSHFSFPKHPGLITSYDVRQAVSHIKSRCTADIGEDKEGSAIFFAQTERDRTLIHNGTFLTPESIVDFVTKHPAKKLFIKPHPLAADNPVINLLQSRFNGEILTETNTYAILSSNRDIQIITASSSVYHEALAFGKTAHRLNATLPQHLPGCTKRSLWAHYCPSFWANLLGDVLPRQRANKSAEPNPRANTLRKKIGYYGLEPDTWPDDMPLRVNGIVSQLRRRFSGGFAGGSSAN